MSYEEREQMLDDLGYHSFREAAYYEGECEEPDTDVDWNDEDGEEF